MIPCGLQFKTMTIRDLPSILAIEETAFQSQWTGDMFRQELVLPFSRHLVARLPHQGIAGYIIFWILHDEVQLQRIAVKNDLRGHGIGVLLIREMMRICALGKVKDGSLEVRPSNEPALNLYKKFNFVMAGIRKGYYTDTREDALIMTFQIDGH
ncbi:MAG: ribosomal protein S18-alanine N-acetyltransferase [Deltaproteobacteria bacterium]|nr:ribosomal protein S18-alanine N-acetyltransferase [Deltaproteobacteria bacterium]